ncbi:sensor histidine kinase [Pseudonocardia sp. KRD291]|uniref:sensor histidine kinase n=1 Tax=Pseudonocardia sp. KRD291 TaxID=2792007 RepID=UPI001C49E49E|nr:histidine kinase [Pseudonocardia sp. KRD291]MBW0104084.1 sensor histidine kinase [Pseudonocardia sp. KRD291]
MSAVADTGRRVWHPRVTDALLVVIPAVVALLGLRIRLQLADTTPPGLAYLDLAVGLAGCLALWWRRRFPLALAVGLVVLSAFAESASAAALVALFTVAIHCSPRATTALAAANLLALGVYYALHPVPTAPLWLLIPFLFSGPAIAVAWGLLVRSRRQLIASLRDRATMAEIEAQLRSERTQHEARETLAREMHDALGHRLSLLSVHAGALAYHRDAPVEETARAAEVIRENAHRALQDLREVIGVLRAPVGELPLPGVTDIGELVDDTRRAGTPVVLDDEHGVTTGERPVSETVGRTLYRFLQESLTNARKHAPGAPITVRIAGDSDDHLVAEVETPPTPAPPEAAVRPPGSGEGLRGLAERARIVGGRLDYGPTASGGWQVAMRLPWPA